MLSIFKKKKFFSNFIWKLNRGIIYKKTKNGNKISPHAFFKT